MSALTWPHLFQPPPSHWGLRGDPYLWQELEQTTAGLPLPASEAALEALLLTLYQRLVGEAPVAGRYPLVARYQGGGMSSGRVDAGFWLTQGFPLLARRFRAHAGRPG